MNTRAPMIWRPGLGFLVYGTMVLAISSGFAAAPGDRTGFKSPIAADGASSPTVRAPGPFVLGYVSHPAFTLFNETLARDLEDDLAADDDLMAALSMAGVLPAVVVKELHGFEELQDQLRRGALDAAFAPAALAADPGDGYEAFLREADYATSDSMIRQGVIFAGTASPLFADPSFTSGTLREALEGGPFAVTYPLDAAGNLLPRRALGRDWGVDIDQIPFVYCETPDEVVRHVVSGLIPAGACDRDALNDWLPQAAPGLPLDEMARILVLLPESPPDGVVIRGQFHPTRSEAGKILQALLLAFLDGRNGAPKAAPADNEDYAVLRELLSPMPATAESGIQP